MKKPCKVCQTEPKYAYAQINGRIVYMRCPCCGRIGPKAKADATALLYWNAEQ